MTRIAIIGCCVGAMLIGAGCGSASYVKRSQSGGVIRLEGDRNKAMEEARNMMVSHCGGAYTVTEEGEHVIGEDTVADAETYVTEDGESVVTEGGSSTRQATEWRITYVCGNAAPPPPPAAGPGPDDYPPEDEGY